MSQDLITLIKFLEMTHELMFMLIHVDFKIWILKSLLNRNNYGFISSQAVILAISFVNKSS